MPFNYLTLLLAAALGASGAYAMQDPDCLAVLLNETPFRSTESVRDPIADFRAGYWKLAQSVLLPNAGKETETAIELHLYEITRLQGDHARVKHPDGTLREISIFESMMWNCDFSAPKLNTWAGFNQKGGKARFFFSRELVDAPFTAPFIWLEKLASSCPKPLGLCDLSAKEIFSRWAREGHGLLIVPRDTANARVFYRGTSLPKKLDAMFGIRSRSGHLISLHPRVSHATMVHEDQHLSDYPMLVGLTQAMRAKTRDRLTGAWRARADFAADRLLLLLLEWRAETAEFKSFPQSDEGSRRALLYYYQRQASVAAKEAMIPPTLWMELMKIIEPHFPTSEVASALELGFTETEFKGVQTGSPAVHTTPVFDIR